MKKYINKKSIIIASVMLLLLVAVGTTIAYIFTETEPVENTFNPSKVSCAVVENGYEPVSGEIQNISDIKSNVQIKNTGDTDAYIRVAVVVNWMDEAGTKVWATKPVEGTDYSITYATDSGWLKGADGFWYYTSPVAVDDITEVLISDCHLLDMATIPEGFYLSVEIVASALQSTPEYVVTDQWSSGVDSVGTDGTLTIRPAE